MDINGITKCGLNEELVKTPISKNNNEILTAVFCGFDLKSS